MQKINFKIPRTVGVFFLFKLMVLWLNSVGKPWSFSYPSASFSFCEFFSPKHHHILPNEYYEKDKKIAIKSKSGQGIKREGRKSKWGICNTIIGHVEKKPENPHYLFWNLITRSCCNTSHKITCNKSSNNHRSLTGRLFLQGVPIEMQRCQYYWHLANFSGITFRKE